MRTCPNCKTTILADHWTNCIDCRAALPPVRVEAVEHERRTMDKSAIEYGQAPAQWDAASIAGRVAELEKQKDDLLRLCGEILATLKVNRERETLITISQEHSGKFDSWVAAWWKRFNECSNAPLTGGEAKGGAT